MLSCIYAAANGPSFWNGDEIFKISFADESSIAAARPCAKI
jgi:hypothetical protein